MPVGVHMTGPPADPRAPDASTVRVLHVDDDPAYLDLTATYLERIDETFEVTSETGVDDAIETLTTAPIDCVVSDYDMPEADGLTLLQRVRDRGVEIPFVLFTGKGSEEIASEAISAGATDYIQKSGGNDQYEVLANRVRNAVDQHRSRVALAASQERLSRFIDQSPLGTIEYDDGFRIVRVNPAAEEILGYDESELLGGTWFPLVPESDHRHVAALERDLLSDKGGYQSVNENVRRDGERIRCAWHNQVVTDAGGKSSACSRSSRTSPRRRRANARSEVERRVVDRARRAAGGDARRGRGPGGDPGERAAVRAVRRRGEPGDRRRPRLRGVRGRTERGVRRSGGVPRADRGDSRGAAPGRRGTARALERGSADTDVPADRPAGRRRSPLGLPPGAFVRASRLSQSFAESASALSNGRSSSGRSPVNRTWQSRHRAS
ncbi:HTR-like protein [Halorubrum californiense DSM 19288]|uniref:HTR-like protein n=1 Tax=Halorubrum californiense DSM 19288 TaxID=1227465 RepID=M0E306_9EURY|nr:HTR-like protein [Halorubrum californiense DSM 19288]